jgi:predicted RNA binding protein YcfA (HicA-like mRNA interferase family)
MNFPIFETSLIKEYQLPMKVIKIREILKQLKQNGWYLYRHDETSHRQFKHPKIKYKVTVNGKPSDDITGPFFESIEKQSGIKFQTSPEKQIDRPLN